MTNRPDIYSKVHKGLRKALFDLSYTTGNTDFANDESLVALAKLYHDVVKFLHEHEKNEELYQLPLLERKIPGSVKQDNLEHEIIEKKINLLNRSFNNLISSSNGDRKLKGEVFYHLLNEFISDYLNHMRDEELETARLFYEHCTDEEINSVFKKIVANMMPQNMMLMLKYMIPAINEYERVELLKGIKANALQPAFNAIMILTQSLLSANDWEHLQGIISTIEKKPEVWEAVA
jgi:hypothetical protein